MLFRSAVFRQGQEIANAETWKNRTVAANAVAAFIASALAVVKALGYPLDIDGGVVENLAAGVVAGAAFTIAGIESVHQITKEFTDKGCMQ